MLSHCLPLLPTMFNKLQVLIYDSYEVTNREVGLNSLIDDGSDGVVCIGGSSGNHDVNIQPDDGVLLHRVRCALPSGGTLLNVGAVHKQKARQLLSTLKKGVLYLKLHLPEKLSRKNSRTSQTKGS